jgi:hypothetical protein
MALDPQSLQREETRINQRERVRGGINEKRTSKENIRCHGDVTHTMVRESVCSKESEEKTEFTTEERKSGK